MKNKKYVPLKLWIILILIILGSILAGIFLFDGLKKIVMFVGAGSLSFIMPLLFTYYFEVKEDRVIIRHGLSSFNKQYHSSFKTITILFEDINDIDIRNNGDAIIIILKDGSSIYFPIGGYFNRSEIINLFYQIKK